MTMSGNPLVIVRVKVNHFNPTPHSQDNCPYRISAIDDRTA